MDDAVIVQRLLIDLLILLSAGFVSGIVCKRFRLPMVVGYLLIGALIGSGVLGLLKTSEHIEPAAAHSSASEQGVQKPAETTTEKIRAEIDEETEKEITEQNIIIIPADVVEHQILDEFAHLGANLLLFAIGINFSPSELIRVWRYFLVGGFIQMLGVIVPFGLLFHLVGYDWKVGVVLGSAVSLSSTVLVFKFLEDMGLASSLSGLRAVAILLFQDVAIVPLTVLISVLSALANAGDSAETVSYVSMLSVLAVKVAVFVAFVVFLRWVFVKWGVQFLLGLRNVELIVLFTMILLIGVCGFAGFMDLPGALGALAAGVILSDTRLTSQVTAITVAMRETFSAIFFVSLGALFDSKILFVMPMETLGALLGCLAIKTLAAGLAFRILGLPIVSALAMGLGLSQLGELSFILVAQGYATKMFGYNTYQIILFVALTSIILTPAFLKVALRFSSGHHTAPTGEEEDSAIFPEDASKKAIVVGLGPIGGRVVTFLETAGFEVTLIDMNPVNLHPYAQHGFRTIPGNADDREVLRLADAKYAALIAITVPDDSFTEEIVAAVRMLNDHCIILARCRYTANMSKLEKLGANLVLCGEAELANAVVRTLRKLLR
jgi:CPA2 family monovalent cation:H+ antiporter-2